MYPRLGPPPSGTWNDLRLVEAIPEAPLSTPAARTDDLVVPLLQGLPLQPPVQVEHESPRLLDRPVPGITFAPASASWSSPSKSSPSRSGATLRSGGTTSWFSRLKVTMRYLFALKTLIVDISLAVSLFHQRQPTTAWTVLGVSLSRLLFSAFLAYGNRQDLQICKGDAEFSWWCCFVASMSCCGGGLVDLHAQTKQRQSLGKRTLVFAAARLHAVLLFCVGLHGVTMCFIGAAILARMWVYPSPAHATWLQVWHVASPSFSLLLGINNFTQFVTQERWAPGIVSMAWPDVSVQKAKKVLAVARDATALLATRLLPVVLMSLSDTAGINGTMIYVLWIVHFALTPPNQSPCCSRTSDVCVLSLCSHFMRRSAWASVAVVAPGSVSRGIILGCITGIAVVEDTAPAQDGEDSMFFKPHIEYTEAGLLSWHWVSVIADVGVSGVMLGLLWGGHFNISTCNTFHPSGCVPKALVVMSVSLLALYVLIAVCSHPTMTGWKRRGLDLAIDGMIAGHRRASNEWQIKVVFLGGSERWISLREVVCSAAFKVNRYVRALPNGHPDKESLVAIVDALQNPA